MQKFSESFSVGYKESEHVPPGKVSLLQAIDFITKHQSNSTEWTIEKIAEENKIKLDVASKLILLYNFIKIIIIWQYKIRLQKNYFPRWHRQTLQSFRRVYVKEDWKQGYEQHSVHLKISWHEKFFSKQEHIDLNKQTILNKEREYNRYFEFSVHLFAFYIWAQYGVMRLTP